MKFESLSVHILNLFIYPLQLKDDGARAIVAAGYHHLFVVRPALHDGAALQCRVDVAADAIPCFGTECSVQHAEEIVVVYYDFLPFTEIGAWSRLGVCQIFCLQILVTLPFQDGNLTFVFHTLIHIIVHIRMIIKQFFALGWQHIATYCHRQSLYASLFEKFTSIHFPFLSANIVPYP